MTRPASNCPSCGAAVEFRWAGAVQTVCPHCGSVLVRTDVDLRKVGQVSEPPPVTSRIQIGTRGTYDARPFEVVGRIAYRHGRGFWSEWHLAFGDGASGWLSDAQDEYAVTFVAGPPPHVPPASAVKPGVRLTFHDVPYEVSSVTRAHYAGVEGELPFEYWDKADVVFADLRGQKGFATLDYSEDPALLFVGETVELADLGLRGLRELGEKRVSGVQTLSCPSCGGKVELRMAGESVNAVCQYCLTVLDVRSQKVAVLQKFSERVRVKPLIPLGATGTLHGAAWTVLGFQQRTIDVEGTQYSWREYLLHAPERGFRYLTEYAGHWNDVAPLKTLPKTWGAGKDARASANGETFRHFQRASAETSFVLGEFPWEIRVGDRVQVDDYVHPPRSLSREQTPDETSWSVAEYVEGAQIWRAFGLPGAPPRPHGTYANQPSPHPGSGPMWATFLALALVLLGILVFRSAGGGGTVLGAQAAFDPAGGDENVFVSDTFRLGGRPSSVDVHIGTDVDNAWAAFEVALVDEATGRTREAERDIGYYYGVDDGERWSEGSREGGVRIPAVPAGAYRLIVSPQAAGPVRYTLQVTRDRPALSLYLMAFLALLVPPLWRWGVRAGFESKRWSESDYASTDDE